MKVRNWYIVGIAGLVALSMLMWVRYYPVDQRRPSSTAVDANGVEDPPNSQGLHIKAPAGRERGGATDPAEIRTPFDAQTAGQAMEYFKHGNFSDAEVGYAGFQIAQVCDESQIIHKNSPTASDIAAANFRSNFCADFTSSLSDEIDGLQKVNADDPVTQALGVANELFMGAGPNQEAFVQHLDELMWREDAGFEAMIAAQALQQFAHVSDATRTLSQERGWGLGQSELAQAQVLAMQMRMCERYGGCGINQAFTMQMCWQRSACSMGGNADAFWRSSYSPALYAAAREISLLPAKPSPSP